MEQAAAEAEPPGATILQGTGQLLQHASFISRISHIQTAQMTTAAVLARKRTLKREVRLMFLAALLSGLDPHSLKVRYCVLLLGRCGRRSNGGLHGDVTGCVLQMSLSLGPVAGMETHSGWATAQRRAQAVRLRVARKGLAH